MELKLNQKNVAIAATVMIVVIYATVCYVSYKYMQEQNEKRFELLKQWKPCLDAQKDAETIAHESGLLAEEKEQVAKVTNWSNDAWPTDTVPKDWSSDASSDRDSSD
jgi:hypothetical protein